MVERRPCPPHARRPHLFDVQPKWWHVGLIRDRLDVPTFWVSHPHGSDVPPFFRKGGTSSGLEKMVVRQGRGACRINPRKWWDVGLVGQNCGTSASWRLNHNDVPPFSTFTSTSHQFPHDVDVPPILKNPKWWDVAPVGLCLTPDCPALLLLLRLLLLLLLLLLATLSPARRGKCFPVGAMTIECFPVSSMIPDAPQER